MTLETVNLRMSAYLDGLTKPKGSLGKLEDYARRMALIQYQVPPKINRKAVYLFAGDHGIAEEGVSVYPQAVTAQMMVNFLSGGAAINSLAAGSGWDLYAVDAGIKTDINQPPSEKFTTPGQAVLVNRKIGRGSANFLKQAAMSPDQCAGALADGRALAAEAQAAGYDLVAIGDMGIGNTTTAAALLAGAGLAIDKVVDRGTGIDDATLAKKRALVTAALDFHGPFRTTEQLLAALGSFDIAMMAGFILGFKERRIGVLLDGFPVSSAAYIASLIDPEVTSYLFAGHLAKVRGHRLLLTALGLEPIVNLELRLGEGTGALIGGYIVDLAVKTVSGMASFEAAGVDHSLSDEQVY